MMHTPALDIRLSNTPCTVYFASDAQAALVDAVRKALEGNRKAAIVTDEHLAASQEGFFRNVFEGLPLCVLPPGESTKTLASVGRVARFCVEHGLDRTSTLFVVGGGVIGDLAGFAAASYQRGIPYYHIPTTLLAMVDSSLGGKTGVNLPEGKNLVGAFHHPSAIFILPEFLKTLPENEFNAGMAEIIKAGLLGDLSLFEALESKDVLHAQHADLLGVIRTSCAIKARIVEDDEREGAAAAGRALLNLGHTFGHAIESVTGYTVYLHGEAVAIGLMLAARLSQDLGKITAEEVARIGALLKRYQLPTRLHDPLSMEHLLAAMQRDKKNRAGELRLVILESLGEANTISWDDYPLLKRLWAEVGAVY
tara:strand:- start:68 stop:1165 length:1098 start_codon:yes stop_codon:yes gene_type:complete